MKLISFKICPCYQSITVVLEYLALPYESLFLNLNEVPYWFFELSPALEPILEIAPKKYIIGHQKIITHLENINPLGFKALHPVDLEDNHFIDAAFFNYIQQCNTQRSPDQAIFEQNGASFFNSLTEIDAKIIGPYFYGKQLSLIDLFWIPILYRAKLVAEKTGFDYLQPYPQIKKLQNEVLSSSLPQRFVSHDFQTVFGRFYLNPATYLGQLSLNALT